MLGTRRLVGSFALATAIIGCTATTPDLSNSEPSFAEQLRAVKAGDSDQIDVSATPVTDDDLARIAEATALRVLIIDHVDSRITTGGIRLIRALPNLKHLRLRGFRADDDALAEFAAIKSLQILNLPHGEFTDAGLQRLKLLPKLEQLRFGSPHVTDAGMKAIAEFPALLRLHLIDVPIGDRGLRELAKIERLESLYIDGGNFSEEALDELFRARPALHVHLNQEHHDRDPNRH